VSFGGLDGPVVSLVSVRWVGCGFSEVSTSVERRTGLEGGESESIWLLCGCGQVRMCVDEAVGWGVNWWS